MMYKVFINFKKIQTVAIYLSAIYTRNHTGFNTENNNLSIPRLLELTVQNSNKKQLP